MPVLVGAPEIRPEKLIVRPGGSPVAEKVSVLPAAESVSATCRGLIGALTGSVLLTGVDASEDVTLECRIRG